MNKRSTALESPPMRAKASLTNNDVERARRARHRNLLRQITKDLPRVWSNNDYHRALTRIDKLMAAKRGTPEGDELVRLAKLVEAYEAKRFSHRTMRKQVIRKKSGTGRDLAKALAKNKLSRAEAVAWNRDLQFGREATAHHPDSTTTANKRLT